MLEQNNPHPKFTQALEKTGEIGYVYQVFPSLIYAQGLPSVKQGECVIFEDGSLGRILYMTQDFAEVLLFNPDPPRIGTKISRLDMQLELPVGDFLLGAVIDPLGKILNQKEVQDSKVEMRMIDSSPSGLSTRKKVSEALITGNSIVDMLVPLGKGQRELVIGDRKTGKTTFLQSVMYEQSKLGSICIYALVGKRRIDFERITNFVESKKISQNTVIVSSQSTDAAGMIFLAPYTAMTIAEYFRDQGRDVLLIMDDMTTHASYYREISLLGRRFPGRSSYPGDIFYVHAKLLERGGSFQKGTITCLPVGESVLGDLSGYIQTNLMSITDGHIFFDIEVFNQGRRPAINSFLSVTRVGEQAHTPLVRDVSRQLSRFLSHYQKITELVHFGNELEEKAKKDLSLGKLIFAFFNQSPDMPIPINLSLFIIAGLWNGYWGQESEDQIPDKVLVFCQKYESDASFKTNCDQIINSSKSFQALIVSMHTQSEVFQK